VAEPILNASRVVAGIGQGAAAGMAKHVNVNRKGESGWGADALDQSDDGIRRERPAAFGGEHKGAVEILPAQLAQRSTSSPRSGCALGLPFFARRTWSVAARPNSTCDHSRSATSLARKTVAIGNEDQRRDLLLADLAFKRRNATLRSRELLQ
jgi:hypothetical protein